MGIDDMYAAIAIEMMKEREKDDTNREDHQAAEIPDRSMQRD